MYHDQTTRPLNDIRWELFTLLSHGAFVTMVDKTGFDGWLDPVAYERFAEAFAEVKRKREHFGHRPLYDVGLYFSSRTRDWLGREEAGRYFQSFQGCPSCVRAGAPSVWRSPGREPLTGGPPTVSGRLPAQCGDPLASEKSHCCANMSNRAVA